MKITLPDDVKQIIETLEQHGYEGYAVGGCVRDSILGRDPARNGNRSDGKRRL